MDYSSQRAVIWDLDGVIVDSAVAQNASWEAMAREYALPYDGEKDFREIFGRRNAEIIRDRWGVEDREQIHRMEEYKELYFRKEVAHIKPLPGVVDLVSSLSEAGWKQAIGSSAPMENIKLLLGVTGLAEYVEAIASGDDITRGKPDPGVFLLAFRKIGVQPADGLVIEDASVGVLAAKRAGAACLAVTNTEPAQALREAGADRVVSTLEGATVADLDALVRGAIKS